MTKKDSTLIIFVLDRSGSMASIREPTYKGFMEFLEGQKKLPGDARMTLVQFDHEYQVLCRNAYLDDVKLDYVPRGNTALLDAIGRTIADEGERLHQTRESERPSKVVFVITTDGYENASREYNRKRVFDMITHQREKYGWEFLFLGANQDAIAEAAFFGIPANYAATYGFTPTGTQSAYGTISNSVGNSRRGITAQITPEDRAKNEAEVKNQSKR